MLVWKWLRARARNASIMLAVGACAGSSGASAGPEPSPVVIEARAPIDATAAANEPFALPRAGAPSALYASKWRDILAAIERDRTILARCRLEPDHCGPGAQRLLDIVAAAQTKDGRSRLGEINRAMNLAIRYQSDLAQYGAVDAWASPLATMASGRGDCEDYAIAKYLALREAHVAADDLRLVVVRDIRRHEDHAVLTVRVEDRWLVLDNSRLLLLEDRDVRDYVPAIAFGPETNEATVAESPMGIADRIAPASGVAASELNPS
jgi:predicted transglutaminase-like cysteine proteinase